MANAWDDRKKAQEEEYFARQEREKLARLKAQQESEAKTAAQKASSMKCPKCGESLAEETFQSIVIDRCTGCHGIWLDAGELEQVAAKDGGGWLGRLWQKNG